MSGPSVGSLSSFWTMGRAESSAHWKTSGLRIVMAVAESRRVRSLVSVARSEAWCSARYLRVVLYVAWLSLW